MFPTLPTLASALQRAIQLTTRAQPVPFKRSQEGLFHGKMKIYGNSVPFSKKKTRRCVLVPPLPLFHFSGMHEERAGGAGGAGEGGGRKKGK